MENSGKECEFKVISPASIHSLTKLLLHQLVLRALLAGTVEPDAAIGSSDCSLSRDVLTGDEGYDLAVDNSDGGLGVDLTGLEAADGAALSVGPDDAIGSGHSLFSGDVLASLQLGGKATLAVRPDDTVWGSHGLLSGDVLASNEGNDLAIDDGDGGLCVNLATEVASAVHSDPAIGGSDRLLGGDVLTGLDRLEGSDGARALGGFPSLEAGDGIALAVGPDDAIWCSHSLLSRDVLASDKGNNLSIDNSDGSLCVNLATEVTSAVDPDPAIGGGHSLFSWNVLAGDEGHDLAVDNSNGSLCINLTANVTGAVDSHPAIGGSDSLFSRDVLASLEERVGNLSDAENFDVQSSLGRQEWVGHLPNSKNLRLGFALVSVNNTG